MGKATDRLEVLENIKNYEEQGLFDQDVESDPPSRALMPNEIDYVNKKLTSKIKTFFANIAGTKFFDRLIKNGQLVIDKVEGIENFTTVKGGAIITCNHFNVYDNYIVWHSIKPYTKGKKLWKVIKEGNYANSPPPFGFVLRNCNTLPLSSNMDTMKKLLKGIDTLLKRGEKILIYPEQAMWWNYRKPRPLKPGAFRFAKTSNVPVIPMFVTMEDSDVIGQDGFPIQKNTLHIMPAIYPDNNLSKNEDLTRIMNQNYNLWKEKYQEVYKTPLTYSTKKED